MPFHLTHALFTYGFSDLSRFSPGVSTGHKTQWQSLHYTGLTRAGWWVVEHPMTGVTIVGLAKILQVGSAVQLGWTGKPHVTGAAIVGLAKHYIVGSALLSHGVEHCYSLSY